MELKSRSSSSRVVVLVVVVVVVMVVIYRRRGGLLWSVAILSSGPHPPQSLDLILIWIQVAIHYWIGLVWAGLSSPPLPLTTDS